MDAIYLLKGKMKRFINRLYNKIKNYLYLALCFRCENKIFTHLTQDEKIKLLELAAGSSAGIFVEIGSYLGASSCFIAAGIKRAGGDSKLYCVDTWHNDSMTEGGRDTFAEFLKNTSKYKAIIMPLRNTSEAASKLFNEKINFLFIDGGHSYEAVKDDIDSWLPKLNSGAVVIFHDYGWAEGVKKAVDENIKLLVSKADSLPNMWWGYLK